MTRAQLSPAYTNLPHTGSRFLEGTLDAQLCFPELVSRRILDLELLERTRKLSLNLSLGTALELHGEVGRGDGVLDLVDVSLEVGLGLMTSREVLVGLLELLGILDHLVDLGGRETANRVGDA